MGGIFWRIGVAGGLALTMALALGACDSKTVTVQNASTAEVAQKLKESASCRRVSCRPASGR
ncbi:hypothetical protein BH10PSE13_BH10PSE13_20310 [soil metagenome]